MIKNNFKNSIIQDLKDGFSSSSKSRNYLFLGKSTPWSDDSNPDREIDSFDEELKAWNNMLIMKKIKPNEVAFCVRKILWVNGEIYDQYDDIVELYSDTTPINFYVLTDQFNVYKCLSNNNNSRSTSKPTGTGVDLIKTSDGYLWKYLYSIRPELQSFITQDYMPVDFIDDFFYPSGDLRSEQLAVELDAKYNAGNEISNLIITQIGSPYLGAIDYDDYTPSDGGPENLHYVQSYGIVADPSNPNGVSAVGLNKRLIEVSAINDFYVDNYVIYISSGPGSGQVKSIIDYNGSTGVLKTDSIFVDVNGTPIQINSTSSYKILPKIVITGDGTGASFIPQVDKLTKKIKRIICLNAGKDYTKVDAKVKNVRSTAIDQTLLRAIKTPLIGHGGNAVLELGCKNLIIRTVLDSSSTEKLSFFNEYRQVGLIKNPVIVAESSSTEKTSLEIESFSATQELTILFTTPSLPGQPPTINYWFKPEQIASLPGKYLVQGPIGDNQAIGVILSYTPNTKGVVGGVLKVASIKNRFKPNLSATEDIPANSIYLKESPSGVPLTPSLTFVKIKSVVSTNSYMNDSFVPGMKILGETTNSTGVVYSWTPRPDGLSGTLVLTDVKGRFKESTYNSSGVLQPGERFINYVINLSDPRLLTNGGIRKTGIVKTSTIISSDSSQDVYRTTSVVEVARSAGITTPFTDNTFINDYYIKQINPITGNTVAVGRVVDWYINSDDTTKTRGTLIINVLEGQFYIGTSTNLYQSENDLNYENIQNTIVCAVTPSEIEKYSGNMIYINNLLPIQHATDSLEEIKLIIGL